MRIYKVMVAGGLMMAGGSAGYGMEADTLFVPTWSLKNNLLYDATLTPNIGLEVRTGQRMSLQAFYGLNPWKYSDTKQFRHWAVMPELRFWTREAFRGHFFGVHGFGGEYNVGGVGLIRTIKDNHYEGSFWGAGLTYGYAWRIGRRWNMEAALGVGVAWVKYDKYVNEVCGELLGSDTKTLVGPTKLALNIAYLFGYKKKVELPREEPVVVRAVTYKPDYKLAYVMPQAEQEKTRQLSGRAFIDFVVNKTDIRPNYRGNAAELAKVMRTIDAVRLDTFAVITHISIHGYALPESPYKHNAYLAENRAQAFADYVQSLMALPKDIFAIDSTPEDWQGLRDVLMKGGRTADEAGAKGRVGNISGLLPQRDRVMAIIDDPATDADQKERLLKQKMPREWRLMLDSIFPALRHSDYEVTYTIRPFTVEEATRVIREKPQHLSLNEMFLVANTYKPGSQDYNDVFETAVRMYPDDQTANLNAAVIALEKNDLAAARRYLAKAGDSPEAQNARGLLAVKQGRYEEAEAAFRQALPLAEAQHNLDELQKARALQ